MSALRTERTFGVTAELKPVQRRNLTALKDSDLYQDILDVMEMVCIETESKLINTDAGDEAAVLANHKMAKAAWQMFTHLQEKIAQESQLYLRSVAKQPIIPQLTRQERWKESTLNPTIPEPEDDEEDSSGIPMA